MPGVGQNDDIRAALGAVVNGVDIFAGADSDPLTTGYRQPSIPHFNDAGSVAAANLWVSAIRAVF